MISSGFLLKLYGSGWLIQCIKSCFILLYKVKQENSGWPSWCVDEASRRKYIEDYFEKEGVRLEYDKIKKNPGLRSLAKLMLNR